MEPTLYGDDHNPPGDRVVVDKLAHVFQGPKRWEVNVFHHVLNWNRNFIKRVLVLPNEAAQIVQGDVWIAPAPAEGKDPKGFHPARKPARVREQLYVPVYPSTDPVQLALPGDFWRPDPGTTGAFHLVSHREFRFERAKGVPATDEAEGVLRYGFTITSEQNAAGPRRTEGQVVRDVRLRATVRAEDSAEVEVTWRPGDGREHVLRLASEGRPASGIRTRSTAAPIDRRLAVGASTAIALESVDGDVRAWVDGDEVRVVEDELPFDDAVKLYDRSGAHEAQSLSLRAKGGPLSILDLRLDHDLHYVGAYERQGDSHPAAGDSWVTGPDEYAMLGDNTTHSSDSRAWTVKGVRLKDGTEIWWDPDPREGGTHRVVRDGRTLNECVDVEGVTRRWADEDRDEAGMADLSRRIPFVKRERIVGRAFFAFVFSQPLDPAFLARLRFVH
jgi:hypothetical protein